MNAVLKSSYRPIGDRIVVRRAEGQKFSLGGIALPDAGGPKPCQGTIVAIGKGKTLEDGSLRPLDVATGDMVMFGEHSGTEVIIDGMELLVMREEDVMCVVEPVCKS